jgi:GDP-L-fucose synthase
MDVNGKVYIAGHSGLVGSAILRELKARGFTNCITRSHQELDLTNQTKVNVFFKELKPEYVILAAAKVGGIFANSSYPVDFIYQNIMIEANIINAAYENNVKRLLFLGSSCIYPKFAKQPMEEEELLSGFLEPTNEPYALAKILGIKLCESYNIQYATDYRSVMPTNLYGINDNFHPKNSHVIAGLMQRMHEAKLSNDKEVVVWGSGKAIRDFLYVDDMAKASLFILELDKFSYQAKTHPSLSHINIGTAKGVTIKKLAEIMKEVIGYEGRLVFDKNFPDGAPKKLLNVKKIENLGWKPKVDIEEGLIMTYKWYKENAL